MTEKSPLPYRPTGSLKHAWKVWQFERKAKKARRAREREFQALLKR